MHSDQLQSGPHLILYCFRTTDGKVRILIVSLTSCAHAERDAVQPRVTRLAPTFASGSTRPDPPKRKERI